MAVSFLCTLYGQVSYTDNLNGGIGIYGNGFNGPSYQSLTVAGTKVTGISPAQVIQTKFGTVTVNSLVEVLPTGLTIPAKPVRYICDATVAALNTLRNA